MKIVNIHDYPPTEGGGIEINVSRVADAMVRFGHEVTITTSRASSEVYKEKKNNTSEYFTAGGTKVVLLENYETLKRLIDEADIVHIHFTFSCRPASMYALEYCVETNKKCFFSVRTNWGHIPFSALANLSPLEKEVKLKKLAEWLSSDNVYLLGPSQSTEDSIKRLGVKKELRVVHNGISNDPDKYLNVEENLEIQEVHATYLGEISILKGLNYLLDAVRELKASIPDIKVRLIGGGADFAEIARLVDFFELRENILFAGYIENAKVPQFLKRTKLVVHPSLTETWCNAVAEALAFGVPVIASSVEGLIELTQKGDFAELVPFANSHLLAESMFRHLSDKNSYEQLCQKAASASSYITTNYTLENQVKTLLNYYTEKQ